MNYVFCFQIAAAGYHCTAYKSWAYFVAFFLDFRAAFSFDCSCDTAAQNQLSIGGINNSIGLHFGNIAFEKLQNAIFDIYFHNKNLQIQRTCDYKQKQKIAKNRPQIKSKNYRRILPHPRWAEKADDLRHAAIEACLDPEIIKSVCRAEYTERKC